MIRIARGATRDGINAYKIFINGIYRGKIGNNETKEFEVEDGDHTVYAKILWYRSKEIHIHVNHSTVELEVGNALDRRNPWTTTPEYVILRNIFLWKEYLFLREKERVDEDVK